MTQDTHPQLQAAPDPELRPPDWDGGALALAIPLTVDELARVRAVIAWHDDIVAHYTERRTRRIVRGFFHAIYQKYRGFALTVTAAVSMTVALNRNAVEILEWLLSLIQ